MLSKIRQSFIPTVFVWSLVLIVLAVSMVLVAGFFGIIPYKRVCTTTETRFIPPPQAENSVRFAILGDLGPGGTDAENVARLVLGWDPEFILTVGDNDYGRGPASASTLDRSIGQYYHAFIGNYQGNYGAGADQNRFFPILGNHDWMTGDGKAYLDYFDLPGNERYYDFVRGPVHFFALSSDQREPDGVSVDSLQADWLRSTLAESTSAFNLVYMHHPPFSSGRYGSSGWMRWPFREWGADVVVSGHSHTYERIVRDELLYLVDGLAGKSLHSFSRFVEGSQWPYNCGFGALLVEATEAIIEFRFVNTDNILVDYYMLSAHR
jgi:tartrate-resistant acid phosphatase type 5